MKSYSIVIERNQEQEREEASPVPSLPQPQRPTMASIFDSDTMVVSDRPKRTLGELSMSFIRCAIAHVIHTMSLLRISSCWNICEGIRSQAHATAQGRLACRGRKRRRGRKKEHHSSSISFQEGQWWSSSRWVHLTTTIRNNLRCPLICIMLMYTQILCTNVFQWIQMPE